MTARSALHLIDPGACPTRDSTGSDEQALALLEQLYGRDPKAWSRELFALYYVRDTASEALALALADRLWLRPRVLSRLPAACLAGALDYLGRQQAEGAAIIVAPHSLTAPATSMLLQLDRALELSEQAPGVRRLVLLEEAPHQI